MDQELQPTPRTPAQCPIRHALHDPIAATQPAHSCRPVVASEAVCPTAIAHQTVAPFSHEPSKVSKVRRRAEPEAGDGGQVLRKVQMALDELEHGRVTIEVKHRRAVSVQVTRCRLETRGGRVIRIMESDLGPASHER